MRLRVNKEIWQKKTAQLKLRNLSKNLINLKEKEVIIKGIKHIGFVGEFKVNFDIPDYLGLGKSVSKGFGTIKKVG